MKTLKALVLLFCSLTLSSCNESNDDNNEEFSLEGGWTLTKVQGGIAGINDNFDEQLITWTFNADGTISIWNTNTDENKTDFFDTGEYDFAIEPNSATPESCAETLFLDNVSFGCHSITGNTLTLSQVENDGYQLTLKRIIFTTN
jgi:hypothetical protein